MKKILFAVIALLAFGFTSKAQQEYAYGHALDLKGGYAGRFFRIPGSEGSVLCKGDGSNWAIRYTFYPGDHWGVYASGALGSTDMDDRDLYARKYASVNDSRYSYFSGRSYWGFADLFSASLVAGAAYRYDFGQWSLRPRAGLGCALLLESHGSNLYRVDRNDHGKRPEFVGLFMADGRSLMCQASLQLTYTICHHFYFSLEAELNALPNRMTYWETVRETILPDEHYEDYPVRPVYIPEGKIISKNEFQHSAGLCWNISFGVGWNIGFNRYERGRR